MKILFLNKITQNILAFYLFELLMKVCDSRLNSSLVIRELVTSSLGPVPWGHASCTLNASGSLGLILIMNTSRKLNQDRSPRVLSVWETGESPRSREL
jgi:hypothetical protein